MESNAKRDDYSTPIVSAGFTIACVTVVLLISIRATIQALINLAGFYQLVDQDLGKWMDTHAQWGLDWVLTAWVLSWVFFVVWLYRTSRAVGMLGATGISDPVLAIIAWCVPILNLYLPYYMVSCAWKVTDPDPLRRQNWKQLGRVTLPRCWWAMVLIKIPMLCIQDSVRSSPIVVRLWVNASAAAADAIGAAITIALVYGLTARCYEVYQQLRGAETLDYGSMAREEAGSGDSPTA